MKKIVFLTSVMKTGFGVSIVIHELSKRLISRGFEVEIGALGLYDSFPGCRITGVNDTLASVNSFLQKFDSPIVVAHTSPFFEMAEALSAKYDFWAYEHGNPEPTLFPHEAAERTSIKNNKVKACYPFAKGILSISDFVRSDISWLSSEVVFNGCDHITDLGTKTFTEFSKFASEPLKIGTLMRFGSGEAKYKGADLFSELFERLKSLGVHADFYAAGKGDAKDVATLKQSGVKIHLNLSEEAKVRYLRGLDVFISCSQWEGFNLPLVEAQALGTLSLAFDTGAHPETCPFIFQSTDEILIFLKTLSQDRDLLRKHSKTSYQFARRSFSWDRAVNSFLFHVGLETFDRKFHPPKRSLRSPALDFTLKFFHVIKSNGLKGTVLKIIKRLQR